MADTHAAAAIAKQVVSEDEGALKVVVVDSGPEAGVVSSLLLKAHHVPKNQVAQIGPTCSDEQIDQLLTMARPIVIVPKGIINHRPCSFRLPPGSHHRVAIQWLDGEVSSLPMKCEGPTFSFELGWFS